MNHGVTSNNTVYARVSNTRVVCLGLGLIMIIFIL